MIKEIVIDVPPDKSGDKEFLYSSAAQILNKNPTEIKSVVPVRRSVDARSRNPVYKVLCEIYLDELPELTERRIRYQNVNPDKKAVIIGSGPAGLYAALQLIELGIKPIIFERGKDVRSRRVDLRNIQQDGLVNPDSNYCFGEGGAGTYSDGKLYTRSTKRGDIKKILQVFVQHGADADILIDAHPHIGSNKLPNIIASIRETILRHGGEIHFNSRLTDIIISDSVVKGIIINDKQEINTGILILATGHSARDIYHILHKRGVQLEQKPYAMGVRIEHPQQLINEAQYHTKEKNPNLPAASYALTCNYNEQGVYSFCMCPGGIIVPSATAPGEIVVNGMSLSRRDSPFANSGFVVSVNHKDWQAYESEFPFAGSRFQEELEKKAFLAANNTQKAPAQRAVDFMNNQLSQDLPKSSYIPGLTSFNLQDILPQFIVKGLKHALIEFNKRIKGYLSEDAVMVGVESRTSSPVRIPRDRETFMHTQIKGLFPCGEGAGYAGGIVSAAIDGENCAKAAARVIAS